jgi:hypothetical protein
MTRSELPEGCDTFVLDEATSTGDPVELEVIVDPEEGLAFGLYWVDGNRLLAVWAASTA